MRIVEKIAFLVHEPAMYAHYANVWACMPKESFVVVLLGPIVRQEGNSAANAAAFIAKMNALDYEIVYLDELVRQGVKYRYVVSNHVIGGCSTERLARSFRHKIRDWLGNEQKRFVNAIRRMAGMPSRYLYSIDQAQYPPLQAGICQIRFMYGADISDSWSLDAWNSIYDLFLCHGPNDEKHLKARFKGRTAIMGYPRYDGYFSLTLDTDSVMAEFDIDPTKRTLLWMPTFDAFKDDVCSIPFFAQPLSLLIAEFNVIVRPHPISFRADPEGINLLESLGFKIDREPMRDMNALFKVADTVLCDHGGSAFGALYLGKKLVFLKTPTKEDATVLKDSSNLDLMKHFPAFDASELSQLREVVLDEAYWESKLLETRVLSDRYFADFRGNSAQKAAAILGSLDMMLGVQGGNAQ